MLQLWNGSSDLSAWAMWALRMTHLTLLGRCPGHPTWPMQTRSPWTTWPEIITKMCIILWSYQQNLACFSIVCTMAKLSWSFLAQMVDKSWCEISLCSKHVFFLYSCWCTWTHVTLGQIISGPMDLLIHFKCYLDMHLGHI